MSRRKLDNFHLFAGAVVQMKTSDILVWHDSKYAAVSYAYTVGTLDVDDFLRFAIHDVLVVWNVSSFALDHRSNRSRTRRSVQRTAIAAVGISF